MKKMLLSVLTIVAVGGAVAGITAAYYNDTETSTGNLFVAGSVDLKVDQTLAWYNGEPCESCHQEIVSDTTNTVDATTNTAVSVTPVHPAWNPGTVGIPGADWIWITNPANNPSTETHSFKKSFTWTGAISLAKLKIASDNTFVAKINGITVATDTFGGTFASPVEVDVTTSLVTGVNTIEIFVTNIGAGNSGNPAGLRYKVTVDGTCGYENTPNATCQLWGPKDLDKEHFFHFGDVKPGDSGTNVVSLHVDTNDAYACLMVKNPKDDENDHLILEGLAGDSTTGPTGNGELSNDLNVVVWNDTTSDGVHQVGEGILYQGGIDTEMIQLSLTGGGPTSYVGIAWCAGTQTVNTTDGTISCDGAGMSNKAQTDSFIADVVAYGEQQRNNPNFSCEKVTLPGTPQ